EERREVAGVPEEVVSATKPQQALARVTDALAVGIEATRFAGDEVYCGGELRQGIRPLSLGYRRRAGCRRRGFRAIVWPEQSGMLLYDELVLTDVREAGAEVELLPCGALTPRLLS
ncbi:DUF6758 family protein, partial [Streptomyces sp. NPDC093595]|uniref:DUF6758 family protein n=1 Tax=Streptomyces sp. NPDC093595 TaxID=3366045 RepID=UPI003812AFDC